MKSPKFNIEKAAYETLRRYYRNGGTWTPAHIFDACGLIVSEDELCTLDCEFDLELNAPDVEREAGFWIVEPCDIGDFISLCWKLRFTI